MVWTPDFFRQESAAIRDRPWYQNYRAWSAVQFVSFVAVTVAFY